MSSEHLEYLARVYSARHYALYDLLDESLEPRGPDVLFDVAAGYLTSESCILDIGCRDAKHLIRLVQTHSCRGVGLDPLDWHVERARAAVEAAELVQRIEITKGVMELIEQPDARFDFIWCRDVLELVDDLDAGLAEAVRVLKFDGAVLVYTVFATELLAPHEAELIHERLGSVAANFDENFVESALRRAGLSVVYKDVIGTEWREYEEEREQPVSRDLLRLARLRRRRSEVVEQYGQELYEVAEASLHWLAYLLLGKLQPTLYVLQR